MNRSHHSENDNHSSLTQVDKLAGLVRRVAWFSSVGEPLGQAEQADAETYLSNLGFPDAAVIPVTDWEEAEYAVRNPDWNSDWWEAEEQLRAGLIADALAQTDEQHLMTALTRVTTTASAVVHGAAAVAAARMRCTDQALIRAAAGAATQASYQAALVLAAQADEDHPFSTKFRLFEAGRWPLGIVGSSFNLF